jgi:hypothetical protein
MNLINSFECLLKLNRYLHRVYCAKYIFLHFWFSFIKFCKVKVNWNSRDAQKGNSAIIIKRLDLLSRVCVQYRGSIKALFQWTLLCDSEAIFYHCDFLMPDAQFNVVLSFNIQQVASASQNKTETKLIFSELSAILRT